MSKQTVAASAMSLMMVSMALSSSKTDHPSATLGVDSNAEVIAAMTLEEKAALLVGEELHPRGYPAVFGGADNGESVDASRTFQVPVNMGESKRKVPGAAGSTYAIPRLGIPSMVMADGPAGVRIDPTREGTADTFYATGFPIESLLAATWNTDMATRVGRCMGKEALEYGVDVLLGPALNIHRNPLGGRNFEYYSEDPVISGEMAAATVNGVEANGVGTSLKHFAANNNEANRMTMDAVVDPQTLHEIYLKGFEIAVRKSQPWTVMSAYNKVNGAYCAESAYLLEDVLRRSWGFDGFVMTDWFGGRDRVGQVRAGNDLQMPGSIYIANLIVEAVRNGELDEALVDRNIDRILTIAKKTPRFRKYAYSNQPDLEAHALVARQAAVEGMVLLKNERGALPLGRDIKTVAAFGLGTYHTIAVGTGAGNVNMAYTVSIEEGLKKLGVSIPATMKTAYAEHRTAEQARVGEKSSYFMPDLKLNEKSWSAAEVQQLAAATDAAVITISRTSGEYEDRKVEDDFELTAIERELVETVSKAFRSRRKKVVVLLNVGGVVETASWSAHADAVLLAWQPGQEAGNAIAEILTGNATPSGKLPMSFPVRYDDVPSAASFPKQSDDPQEAVYEEKGLVGYRYYQAKKVPTSYEFGFGLSYTEFKIGDFRLTQGPAIHVRMNVANTGKTAGKEVLQLYVKKPGRNYFELKTFAKTTLLKPGGSEDVALEVPVDDLKIYDGATRSWVLLDGAYEIGVGTSSDQILFTESINL